jgi:hypothetical protein
MIQKIMACCDVLVLWDAMIFCDTITKDSSMLFKISNHNSLFEHSDLSNCRVNAEC